VDLSVYGVFDTLKVEWKYYVISSYNRPNNSFTLTTDVCTCSFNLEATFDNIIKYGKKVETKEDGVKFSQEYKIKWETGSNNTIQEVREQKLDELLDKKVYK
jgi:hypothetical protein